MFVDHLLITKKEYKNVEKHEIQDIIIKQNQIKPAFSMICIREILKIYLEEKLSINYYLKNRLIILKIQTYDGYQRGLALMVYKLFAKKPSWGVVTGPSFMSISSLVLDYDNFSL